MYVEHYHGFKTLATRKLRHSSIRLNKNKLNIKLKIPKKSNNVFAYGVNTFRCQAIKTDSKASLSIQTNDEDNAVILSILMINVLLDI